MATHQPRPSDEDLLDYIAGRSSAEQTQEIEAAAKADDELAADIALMQAARRVLGEATQENAPGPLGWARLERQIDAEGKTAPIASTRPVWQIAAASAVAAIALWQFVAAPLVMPGDDARYETATGNTADGPALTVAFTASATEAQIRALLVETGGQIISGPSALGLWRIGFVDEAARDAATERFSQSAGIVESTQAD